MEIEYVILCAIKWLSEDRRAKSNPKVSDIGTFLRGSDVSRSKTFYHKYEFYARYPSLGNDDIEHIIEKLKKQKMVIGDVGYQLSKSGREHLMLVKPSAFENLYLNTQTQEVIDHYIGSYLSYNRVGVLKKKTLNEWLDRMEGRYAQVSPHNLDEEQIRAWMDCYKVLQDTFASLPKQYEDLYAVFEYVLPNYKPGSKRSVDDDGVRADVILVSKDRSVVLEFKQRDVDFEGFVLQTGKYKTRLERYHEQSKEMQVDAVLVLTKRKNYRQSHENVVTCSKDMLSMVLQDLFDGDIIKHEDIKGWLHSKFIV